MAKVITKKNKSKSKDEAKPEAANVAPVLSVQEMRILENADAEHRTADLLRAVEEQNLRNLALEAAVLENKIEKQKALVARLGAESKVKMERFKALLSETKRRYNVTTENVSYNPNTGAII